MALSSLGRSDLNELLSSLGWTLRSNQTGSTAAGKDAAASGQSAETAETAKSGDSAQISPRVQVQILEIRALYEATYRVSQETGSAMGAAGQSRDDFNTRMAELLAGRAEALAPTDDGRTALDKLAAQFTPDATAGRIFDFATSWYSQWLKGGEDTEESRKAFAEFMGKAIDKGFREAQGVLGKLPDAVQASIDQTRSQVWAKIDEFIANGLARSPEELAVAQENGLAFNATFAAAGDDPVELMREVLDRLSTDGTLRLEKPTTTQQPGKNLELTA
ncbi:MAG TPA: DUF5610 domain-containing protein [Planctomycetota bacterium]|nr:DUF5610 domain-containing protein [Planctomycetota bacterium]